MDKIHEHHHMEQELPTLPRAPEFTTRVVLSRVQLAFVFCVMLCRYDKSSIGIVSYTILSSNK